MLLIALVAPFKLGKDPKAYEYVALVPRAPVGTIPRVAVDIEGVNISTSNLAKYAEKRLVQEGNICLDYRTSEHLGEVVRTMDVNQVANLDAFLHGWAVREFSAPGCLRLIWVDVKDLKSVR